MRSRKEYPIFFDHTGKRWRRVKGAVLFLVLVVIAVAAYFVPPTLKPVIVSSTQQQASADTSTVQNLEKEVNKTNLPVMGTGQFVRVVRVEHGDQSTLQDVFTGEVIRTITDQEKLMVGRNDYAIERYGPIANHQMVLTFDDGPDPAYTPRLLDILSKHGVQATFFVVGENVVKHPEIAKRIVDEGHMIANHTFSHIDFDYAGMSRSDQEITQTQRVIRATTGAQTALMRVPYTGSTDESQRDNTRGILFAQRAGYVETAFDYDTDDWKFTSNHDPAPEALDGSGKIVLLHDSGGNRSYTLDYVEKLIVQAKQAGYTFTNLDHVYPGDPLQTQIAPTTADKTSLVLWRATLVWPVELMFALFGFSVVLILAITGTNIILAFASRRKQRKIKHAPKSYQPEVTVLVPAYNEEKLLEDSVHSLLESNYRKLSVLIIDDGSKDATYEIAKKLSAENMRVDVLHQSNLGKSAALNNGLRRTNSEIVISIDADTMFEPDTVEKMVRHFHDKKVGAVAGTVRVGNVRNMLTRWQALEYITSIAIERAAQAFLGAIMVVPGACGAWRREALLAVGGFSDRTLAEDCDVALSIHEAGYTIVQDTSAIGYTECPLSLGDLAKQRFRWIFGNIQSYWKHRHMFFNRRFGWLGTFVLPSAAITLLMPLIFWPLLVAITISNVMTGRWWVLLLFPVIIMGVQAIVAAIGLKFAGESMRHLLALPLTRIVYGPLRTYILYRSLLTVSKGALVGWNKFKRTNTMDRRSTRHAQFSRAIQTPAEE